MNSDSIRKLFPQYNTPYGAYLDSGASSLTPTRVTTVVNSYYENARANVHRGLYKEAEKATELYEDARRKTARFFGAKEEEVVFTGGSTLAMNMLVSALSRTISFKEGDEIVVSILEHHAVFLPLQVFAKEKNLKLIILPRKEMTLDESGVNLIGSKTKIVALTLASNITGARVDISPFIKKAKEVGAVTIIDGAQAVGHTPVSFPSLDSDFFFFSGHKAWGPTGTGALLMKKEWGERLQPGFFGGGMVEAVSLNDVVYAEAPFRFEAGTPNIGGAIGMAEGLETLQDIGILEIEKHSQNLLLYAKEKMEGLKYVTLFMEQPEKNVGIISFMVEGVHPHDVADILAKEGVSVRAGHHCAHPFVKDLGVPALVRASFHAYNNKDDVDSLIEAIQKAKNIFS